MPVSRGGLRVNARSPEPDETAIGETDMSRTKTKTRTELAIDAGALASSLISVCRAAAEFCSEQQGYEVAKNIPADVAHVLTHVEGLVLECIGALELVAQGEGVSV